jgi:hypothetical protein
MTAPKKAVPAAKPQKSEFFFAKSTMLILSKARIFLLALGSLFLTPIAIANHQLLNFLAKSC